LRAENILVSEKLAGFNKYCDDDEQCPYTIQILNYGQNPDFDFKEVSSKQGFSHLYHLAPEQISNNKS